MTFHRLLRLIMVAVLIFVFVCSFVPPAVNAQETTGQTENVLAEEEGSGGLGGYLLVRVSERMQAVTEQLAEAGQGALAAPALIQSVVVKAKNPDVLMAWGVMAGNVVLVLVAGLFAAWVVHRMLGRLYRRVEGKPAESISQRVMFLIGRTISDVIPVAVFAMVTYGILPFMQLQDETRLIALTLVNASVLVRILLIAFRFIMAADVPSLRMLPMGEETVHYLYLWIRRLAGLGVYGYFILETAFLIGLPGGLYMFLMKLLGLVVTVMLIVLVLQNKEDVSRRLRQRASMAVDARTKEYEQALPEKKGMRRGIHAMGRVLNRLADIWHIAAIVLIIGFFLVWAIEVEGGVAFLVSGLAMTVVVVAAAGLLVRLVHRGVDRLFEIREDVKKAYPGLEERANRYQPLVRNVLTGIVYVIAVFSILEVWGLGTLSWVFSPIGLVVIGEVLVLGLIIAGIFLLWEFTSAMIERSLAREQKEGGSSRKLTLLPLLKTIFLIILVLIGSMLVLAQIGINIAPLLAGVGVLGLAVGFGAQTLVRDVITGAFILLEDAISVGDWVEVGGHSGTVEKLTVRTVTLRDLSGTVRVVPFGEVTTVTNYNRDYAYALIDAGVAYRESYGDVVQALQDVAVSLRQDENWRAFITGDLEVFGMNNLGDSAVEIRVRIKTLPMRQFAIRRVFLERMKRVFDERGIEIPFPHRTVWFGEGKDGTAPPMNLATVDAKTIEPSSQKAAAAPDVNIVSESDASDDVVEESEESDREDASTDKPGDR